MTEGAGHIKIPDLSEETYDDLEMTVVVDEEKAEKRPLKEAMRTTGAKRIREACIKFVKDAVPAGLTEHKVALDAATKSAISKCAQQ